MKCQMKKWRMERLQLESENRSLKQTLQTFGVNADEILKPDPLVVHSREEIERLQNANAALEDKVRDLEETLAERDCCDDPGATIFFLREKMRYFRERFALEKKEENS